MSYLLQMKLSRQIYHRLIEARSDSEDIRRREVVLNMILVGLVALAFVALLSPVLYLLSPSSVHNTSSIISGLVFLMGAVGLLKLSRSGHSHAAAYTLLILLALTITSLTIQWSFELPIAELTYALTIVTAGVLLNTRGALVMTSLISLTIVAISLAQVTGLIDARTDWASQAFQIGDAIGYLAVFAMIGLIAWLGNREIDHSLARALASEKALAMERDQLEVAVIERTRQLEAEQLTRLLSVQRFAEYGRISAGMIHDVSNPLTAALLNLDQLHDKQQSALLTKARDSLLYLERYISAARKQIKSQDTVTEFSVVDELDQVISILDTKAKKTYVRVRLSTADDLLIYGDPVKFSQLSANLISNAIESYKATNSFNVNRTVDINATSDDEYILLSITDHGTGISKNELATIFEPFYTTKTHTGRGIGIGLVIVKDYVEKDFNGTIIVDSTSSGTKFTLKLRGAS